MAFSVEADVVSQRVMQGERLGREGGEVTLRGRPGSRKERRCGEDRLTRHQHIPSTKTQMTYNVQVYAEMRPCPLPG